MRYEETMRLFHEETMVSSLVYSSGDQAAALDLSAQTETVLKFKSAI